MRASKTVCHEAASQLSNSLHLVAALSAVYFGAILERLECLDLAYSADQGHHFPWSHEAFEPSNVSEVFQGLHRHLGPSCCQESRNRRMVREFTTVISGIPRSHQQPQVGVAHLTKLW
jgi:hypothetical protein